jgi:hypothetical protein
MIPRDDDARDAHLLAALRHAPDRQAAPPAELSAAILAAARAAVRPDVNVRRGRGSWRERVSTWFGRPHAPWAAAFGTLALGAILGLMWTTIAPPLPPAAPPLADAPIAARAQPSPSASVQAVAGSKDAPATLAKAPTPAAAARPSRVAAPGSSTKGKEAPAPEPPPSAFAGGAAPARVESPEKATGELSRRDSADAASAANAAPAAAAAPAPMVMQELDLSRVRQERAAATLQLAAKRVDLMSSLDGRVRSASGDGVWRGAAASWPHGEAQRRWWASVKEATQGRWQLQTTERDLAAPWLTLTADNRNVVRFWIEDGALWVREGDGLWRAAVGEAQLREWQEAVARW